MSLERVLGILGFSISVAQFVQYYLEAARGTSLRDRRQVLTISGAVAGALMVIAVLTSEVQSRIERGRLQTAVIARATGQQSFEDVVAGVSASSHELLFDAMTNLVLDGRLNDTIVELRGPSGAFHRVRLYEVLP